MFAILARETFQAGPGLNEGAVGGEVFVAGPAFLPGEVVDFDKEEFGDLGGKDALIVLSEDAMVKTTLAELAVQEPKPEQVVAQLLAEEPFAAHTVEGGQDAGLEELFGRDAGAAFPGIEIVEQGRELLQHRVDAAFNGPERMVGGHEGVEMDDGQKVRLGWEVPRLVI